MGDDLVGHYSPSLIYIPKENSDMVGNHPIGISNAAFYDFLYSGYMLSDGQLTQAITTLVEIQQTRNSTGGALKNEANMYKNHDMTCPKGHPLVKKGRSKTGTQRYFCKICKKTYSGSLETSAMYSKISQLTWGQFIQITTAMATLRQISTILHINKNTAWLERHKMMKSLSDIQKNVYLSGNIYIDEMYMTFRHMSDKKRRGISNQQYKIFVAVDDNGHSLIIPYGTGKATQDDVNTIIMPHISTGLNHIYTDQNNCYCELANAGMTIEMIKADVSDPEYKRKMKPINNFCSFVRGMIERT